MKQKIRKALQSLPDNYIVGLVVTSENYEEVVFQLLHHLINKQKAKGIYITVNKPHSHLVGLLKKNKIDPNKLVFIDCITRKLGVTPSTTKGVHFIDSPKNLIDISISLHEAVVNMEGLKCKKFIFIDSLSTLLIHNEISDILKFIHYMTGKMRMWNLHGVMISIHGETDKRIIAAMRQFSDKLIRL